MKRVNPKQQVFCKEYMSGNNATRSYMAAYPKAQKNSANTSASRLLSQDSIRSECLSIMEKTTGLRLTDFLMSLKSLSQAEYPLVIDKTIKMYADNSVRLEAIKTGFKLLGLLSPASLNYEDNRAINVTLNTDDIKDLQQVIRDLKEMRSRDDRISGVIE